MGIQLKKSTIPTHLVQNKITQSYEAFRTLSGKNPTAEQRQVLKQRVVDAARRVERDGGIK